MLVNLEVEDATATVGQLMAAGVTLVQPLRDELFGQRHAILLWPDGVLLDVIQPIPPSPEYAALYSDAENGQ